jgi:hypothetical protein
MAPRLRSASALHNVLPEEALRVIMLALPLEARARAACVCRSWRAFLADPSLWLVLDLTGAGGVTTARMTENLVRGAVARAGGRLRILHYNRVPTDLMVEVLVSEGAELEQVHTTDDLSVEDLEAMLAAAPRLQVFTAQVEDTCTALLSVLRNDPPYGLLRVTDLRAFFGNPLVADADMLAFAAAVAAHESLKGLHLFEVPSARGLNALVDAAAERRVSNVKLHDCVLDAQSVPALARLLQRGSLTKLDVSCFGFPHAEQASVLELCAALRACRTLTSLGLRLDPHNGASRRTVTQLLYAAASLPALSELSLSGSEFQDTAAFGHALGALLAANPPSLHTLDVGFCHLGDEGMAPLLEGLAANTHLRVLWYNHNNLSEAFQHDRLAPALAPLTARAALYRRMARSL